MNRDGSTLFEAEGPWALRLLAITDGCAPSMHEPDSVTAQLVGTHGHATPEAAYLEGSFDNAMGDHPDGGELTLTLAREVDWDDEGSPTDIRIEHFNLATLVAFARIGAAAVAKSSSVR